MIALVQFDAPSVPHLYEFLEQGRLPTLARLRKLGDWLSLETPAVSWEGATYHSLYSGKALTEHGVYSPFVWAAAEQRVRWRDAYCAGCEPIWDRIARFGRRALVIDPYETDQARSIDGLAVSGWQFRHKITLRKWCVPKSLDRELERRFGRAPLVEEIYGRPSARYLSKMRHRLLGAPKRAAAIATDLLAEESFDLVWITLSSSHIAGHWFLDISRLPLTRCDAATRAALDETLCDAYRAVDEALGSIVNALPLSADLIVLSASGMGPNTSRAHLLPGMLQAVLSGKSNGKSANAAGKALWRLRAAVPPAFRVCAARVLPDPWVAELTARLAMRGVDWATTRAFVLPSGGCGYVRLNLRDRERDGIVDPEDADQLLEEIARGLRTFRDPDGEPAVKEVDFASASLGCRGHFHPFPDLIVHWSERLPRAGAGVSSAEFGEVPPAGWGSGRTGEHCDGAWALIIPRRSCVRKPIRPPHILDIAPTVCSVLGVDRGGISGEPLLEPGR